MKIKTDSVYGKSQNEEKKKAQCFLAKLREKNGCPSHAKSTGAVRERGRTANYVPVAVKKAHNQGNSGKKEFIWAYNCHTGHRHTLKIHCCIATLGER